MTLSNNEKQRRHRKLREEAILVLEEWAGCKLNDIMDIIKIIRKGEEDAQK